MLETERLIHKPFDESDLDDLVKMRSDPDVARYLGGEKAMDRDWNKSRLEFYISCYPKYGFGMHKIYWKQTDELIGWCGLQTLLGSDEIEVGYGLIKSFWRRGIGFEAAGAWLRFGFEEKRLERIVAVASPQNMGSRRILEKLGMQVEKQGTYYNMDCLFYSLSNEDYRLRNSSI